MSTLPTIEAGYATRKNHAVTIAYTHMFSPTLFNEVRYGLATNNLPIFPPINGPNSLKQFGLSGLAPDLPDVPGILNVNFHWTGADAYHPRQLPQSGRRELSAQRSGPCQPVPRPAQHEVGL